MSLAAARAAALALAQSAAEELYPATITIAGTAYDGSISARRRFPKPTDRGYEDHERLVFRVLKTELESEPTKALTYSYAGSSAWTLSDVSGQEDEEIYWRITLERRVA